MAGVWAEAFPLGCVYITYLRICSSGQSAELWPRVLAESRSSGGLGRPGGPCQRPGSVGRAVLHMWHCAQPACARRHLRTSSNKVRCRCASLRKRNTCANGWADRVLLMAHALSLRLRADIEIWVAGGGAASRQAGWPAERGGAVVIFTVREAWQVTCARRARGCSAAGPPNRRARGMLWGQPD